MERLISKEKYSFYEYEIWSYADDDYPDTQYYYYKILSNDPDLQFWLNTNVLSESTEYFDTQQEAKFAAIGHIDLLENGEG